MGKKNWIQGAVKKPGSFTKQAKAAGMGVQEYASYVKRHPEKVSSTTRRRAALARTFNKMAGKKK